MNSNLPEINCDPIFGGIYRRNDIEVRVNNDMSEITISQGGKTISVGSASFFTDVKTVLDRVLHLTMGLEDEDRVRLFNSLGTTLASPKVKK